MRRGDVGGASCVFLSVLSMCLFVYLLPLCGWVCLSVQKRRNLSEGGAGAADEEGGTAEDRGSKRDSPGETPSPVDLGGSPSAETSRARQQSLAKRGQEMDSPFAEWQAVLWPECAAPNEELDSSLYSFGLSSGDLSSGAASSGSGSWVMSRNPFCDCTASGRKLLRHLPAEKRGFQWVRDALHRRDERKRKSAAHDRRSLPSPLTSPWGSLRMQLPQSSSGGNLSAHLDSSPKSNSYGSALDLATTRRSPDSSGKVEPLHLFCLLAIFLVALLVP